MPIIKRFYGDVTEAAKYWPYWRQRLIDLQRIHGRKGAWAFKRHGPYSDIRVVLQNINKNLSAVAITARRATWFSPAALPNNEDASLYGSGDTPPGRWRRTGLDPFGLNRFGFQGARDAFAWDAGLTAGAGFSLFRPYQFDAYKAVLYGDAQPVLNQVTLTPNDGLFFGSYCGQGRLAHCVMHFAPASQFNDPTPAITNQGTRFAVVIWGANGSFLQTASSSLPIGTISPVSTVYSFHYPTRPVYLGNDTLAVACVERFLSPTSEDHITGYLLRSTNMGLTWSRLEIPGFRSYLKSLHPVGDLTTWINASATANISLASLGQNNLILFTPKYGFVSSTPAYFSSSAFVSSDNGTTWSSERTACTSGQWGNFAAFNNSLPSNDPTIIAEPWGPLRGGFIATNTSKQEFVRRTSDGGLTWTTGALLPNRARPGIFSELRYHRLTAVDTGVLGAMFPRSNGWDYMTSADYGDTWTFKNLAAPYADVADTATGGTPSFTRLFHNPVKSGFPIDPGWPERYD